MLETLLSIAEKRPDYLALLGIAKESIGESEAMMKMINDLLKIQEFASVYDITTVSGDRVKYFGLICTAIDADLVYFNNGATVVKTSDITQMIGR